MSESQPKSFLRTENSHTIISGADWAVCARQCSLIRAAFKQKHLATVAVTIVISEKCQNKNTDPMILMHVGVREVFRDVNLVA